MSKTKSATEDKKTASSNKRRCVKEAAEPSAYEKFLSGKAVTANSIGIDPAEPHKILFPYQRDIVKWALRKGRAALFEDCGLGKTIQSVEWAKQVPGDSIILAPLAVCEQSVEEAENMLQSSIRYCRKDSEVKAGITITNYEMLEHFNVSRFSGVVIDESGCLRNFDSKFRNQVIETFAKTPYRLACSATPAPNDYMELGNHAEFLGVMSRVEMLSMFFFHDGGETSKWILKGHAEEDFWKWVCSWAVMIRKPSDLGYSDDGFERPPLVIEQITVESNTVPEGELFPIQASTLQERIKARRGSIAERSEKCIEIVKKEPSEKWLIWCNMNDEQEEIAKEFGDECVSIYGSLKPEEKVKRLHSWLHGEKRILVSKPSILGYGINAQCAARMAFVGLSDSWEQYYQAIRREWRFGQKREVHAYVIASETEGAVVANIKRKEADAERMAQEMVNNMHDLNKAEIHGGERTHDEYKKSEQKGEGWKIRLGDCVEGARSMLDNSVGFSIFSPPFASLYTYSASDRDMGNCKNRNEFYDHFSFLVEELFRIMKPGRNVSFHCMNLPTSKARDGYIGISDFRGDLIRLFVEKGFIYHSEVVIWKDPVTAMQRTKALGLLHKQVKKDSCMSRQGIPDYLVTMRKPGEQAVEDRVSHTAEEFPVEQWQKFASPVWMDINPSDTLQFRSAREHKDERHICIARDSLVLTQNGYVPIQEVSEGDDVLTHEGRWMPVIAKRCMGVKPVVHFEAQGVPNLLCTPDHRIYARSAVGPSGKLKNSRVNACGNDPEWMRAKDCLASYVNMKLPPLMESEYTEEEWWIAGRWLGDGHYDSRGGLHISCGRDEIDMLMDILGDKAGFVQHHEATAQIRIRDSDGRIRKLLKNFGSGCDKKKLPKEAISLNDKLSEALLSGYLSADGHYVEKYRRWTASSVSRALVLGMAMVAQRCKNVSVSVYGGREAGTCVIEGRKMNTLPDWIMSMPKHNLSAIMLEDGAWKKVRRIEEAGECEVWDLQVESDESFTVEGCIVHNCPLQLSVIERALLLWSKKGDLVYSPFTGIGSEAYQSIRLGRKFEGDELKESYWKQACKNSAAAKQNTASELDFFNSESESEE